MQKYLEERGELAFDKIFNQKIGELLLATRNAGLSPHTLLKWTFPTPLVLRARFGPAFPEVVYVPSP